MHELSIAQNIVEIALEQAQAAKANIIEEVEVDVGVVSGIVPETLEFVWGSAIMDTIASGASLKINVIPALAVCNDCGHEFPIEDLYSFCPLCMSTNIRIVSGKELKVRTIRVD